MECKKKGCKNLAYDGKYCNYHQAEIEDRNKKIRSVCMVIGVATIGLVKKKFFGGSSKG